MKYCLTHVALSALLFSGCSAVDGTTSAVSSAYNASVTGVKGLFGKGNDAAVLSESAPEQYLTMREEKNNIPGNYANGIQAAAAAIEKKQLASSGHIRQAQQSTVNMSAMSSMLTSIIMQKDMIESDNINDSFTPLYRQFGVLPDVVDAHAGLLLERGRYADVAELVEGVWTQGAHITPEILNAAGMASFARNDHAGALRFFTEALSRSASDVKTVNNIAVLYLAQHRPAEALQILSALPIRSVQDPQHAERVAFNKALANALIGNMAESKRLLQMTMDASDVAANMKYFKTLKQNPNASMFYLNRAMGLSANQYPSAGDTSLRVPAPSAVPSMNYPDKMLRSRSADSKYPADGFGVRQVFERTAAYGQQQPIQRAAYVSPQSQKSKNMRHPQPMVGYGDNITSGAQPPYAPAASAYVPSEGTDPSRIFTPDNFYAHPDMTEQAFSPDQKVPQEQALYTGTPVYIVPDPEPKTEIQPSHDIAYAEDTETTYIEDTDTAPVDESYVPEYNAGYIMPNVMPTEQAYASPVDSLPQEHDGTYGTYEEQSSYDETEFRADEQISYEQPVQESTEAVREEQEIFDDGQLADFAADVAGNNAEPAAENVAYIRPETSSLPYKRYASPEQSVTDDNFSEPQYYVVEESAADELVTRPH